MPTARALRCRRAFASPAGPTPSFTRTWRKWRPGGWSVSAGSAHPIEVAAAVAFFRLAGGFVRYRPAFRRQRRYGDAVIGVKVFDQRETLSPRLPGEGRGEGRVGNCTSAREYLDLMLEFSGEEVEIVHGSQTYSMKAKLEAARCKRGRSGNRDREVPRAFRSQRSFGDRLRQKPRPAGRRSSGLRASRSPGRRIGSRIRPGGG